MILNFYHCKREQSLDSADDTFINLYAKLSKIGLKIYQILLTNFMRIKALFQNIFK